MRLWQELQPSNDHKQLKMLKPVATNTLVFDGSNEKVIPPEKLIHAMLEKQPEMTKVKKINNFHASLRKKELQTFRNKSPSNRKILDDVLIVF